MRIYLYICLVILSSCLAKDEYLAHPISYELEVQYDFSSPYAFVDLVNKNNTHHYPDSMWHLKFQNAATSWAIFINPLVDMSVHKTTETNFDAIKADYVISNPVDWHKDIPLSQSILPAIGTWGDYNFENPKSFNSVYLLRVKLDANLYYVKFQILGASQENYSLKYGRLGEEQWHEFLVPKNHNYAHSYLAINGEPKLRYIEPKISDWQLNFTFGHDSIVKNKNNRILATVSDSIAIYSRITTNKTEVRLSLDTSKAFDEITYFYAKNLAYYGAEQCPNFFIKYDPISKVFLVNEKLSLICYANGHYVKVRAKDVEFSPPNSFRLILIAQNL